jgi:Domain of unknown function (DUF1906)
MALEGVDYAYGPMPGAAARANGLAFICRYVSTPGSSKNLTAAEIADFTSNGIGIVVIFEQAAGNALGGNAKGAADAQTADAQVAALGLAGCPIYFGVDVQVLGPLLPTVGAYLQGTASVIGLERVGVYGGYPVVKYALDNALATYAWQTAAWSAGQVDSRCNIYQYQNDAHIAGIGVDRDRTVSSDVNYGQATPIPPITPAPTWTAPLTPTPTPTRSRTPSPTPTRLLTPTPTWTAPPIPTPTWTAPPTPTPTWTAPPTPTPTPTPAGPTGLPEVCGVSPRCGPGLRQAGPYPPYPPYPPRRRG